MLWECYLFEPVRDEDPVADETLAVLWSGFEGVLREQLPDAARIVTPSWEDVYEQARWQAFLGAQGYQLGNARSWAKTLRR